MIKSNSIGMVSAGTAVSVQGASSTVLAKEVRRYIPIDDVISVTKAGYLNYRLIVTNSDTSGIEIKMIVCEGTVTDADGNVYQTVRIGNQVWTVENLKTTKYNDGTAIPLVTDNDAWSALTTPAYCYFENVTNADSIKKYGVLYNWYAIDTKKLAPTGWHVPYDADWSTLENYLIANGYNWDGTTTGDKLAKSIAAQTEWETSPNEGALGNDLKRNNSSGFSALPTSYREDKGNFGNYGYSCLWRSATESDPGRAYDRGLDFNDVSFYKFRCPKVCGFSIRLILDNYQQKCTFDQR